MKLPLTIILVAGAAANAQINRSFELGFTGYETIDGPGSKSSVMQVGPEGELPSHGFRFAHLVAGGLSQEQAAAAMDVNQDRLSDLFLSLGGANGSEFGGDYNILAADVPAGTISLDYMYKPLDETILYLDHAFVVNGAGQITVLADVFDGDVDTWTKVEVSHPGGRLYVVSANGGDDEFDSALFVDNTFQFDDNNGSFETGGFQEWDVHDNGSGLVNVTGPFGVIFPTHGSHMATIISGDVAQDDAESILGLEPGRLAQLYTDLGGVGDPTGGDYAIIAQKFGGSTVSMDVAFASVDAGSLINLDHAFAVDSEGNITVLASTANYEDPHWERVTIEHSGGEFFIVCANGNSTDVNAVLFVDNVIEGPMAFDTTRAWNQVSTYGQFGGIYKETIGQVIESKERSLLESIKFFVYESDLDENFDFQAFVYEWSGAGLVGDALYQSSIMTTDGHDGGQLVHLETPGVVFERNRCYVAFLTTTTSPSLFFGSVGSGGDHMPGTLVFNGNDEFDELLEGGWLQGTFEDLAFQAELSPYEEQVVPNVNHFVDGPSLNAFPWNSGGDFRYQQLYSAEQFNGRAGVIDTFAYRVNNIGAAFGPVDIEVEIYMGYSYVNPGDMDARFDENWQFGKTLVHDGPVTLSSTGLGGFDVVVDIDVEFNYDPAVGNLLVEVVFPVDGQPGVATLDSAGYGFASGGTPWTDRLFATSADAVTGILLGDDGLVTQFNFFPEPQDYDVDCDANGDLNILDFVCYQQLFQSGDMAADCNADGALNILDFVCFQEAFLKACG